jgi:cytochrome P450
MSMRPAELDDLLSDEAVNRPTAYYGRLRAHDPVYWNERWNGWILTGYDDVVEGFRNHQRLSSDRFAGPFGQDLSAASSGYDQLMRFLSRFFVWKDQPYHTRVRGLVNKAFTPRSVEVLRPRVRELIAELLEPLRAGNEVDFLGGFAFTLPVIVIGEYLGVPEDGRDDLRRWAEALGAVIFVSGNDEDRLRRGEEAMGQLADFLRPVIAARRAQPREDLLSGMLQAAEGGDVLSEDEVIANVILMVFAGHETTMNLLANGIVAFWRHPDQWAALRADPSLAATATEEILRYDGPIRAMARWAREPVRVRDREIGAGQRVLLVQQAANHDPAHFADPGRLDITRWPNRHTTFGQGIHTCLGAPLARLEAQEAFGALAAEFAGLEITEPELRYVPNIVSRSLQGLHARFGGSG